MDKDHNVALRRSRGHFPGEYILLALSDIGCGMNKEALGKLFEIVFKSLFTTKGQVTFYGIVSKTKENHYARK